MNLPCDVTVPAGDPAGPALADGVAVCLAAGDHPGGIFLDQPGSFTLRGPGRVDAGGRGAALRLPIDDVTLVVDGVTFANGRGELGATVRVDGWSRLELRDGVIEGGRSAQGGASALGAAAGELDLARMEIRGDVLFTGAVTARLVDCEVTGEVRVREGATVELRGGSIRGGVNLRGTTTRAPTVTLVGVQTPVTNDESLPGTVHRR